MTFRKLPANTPTILRNAGLTVVEVPDWQTRSRPTSTGNLNPVGVLCHHTATSPKASNAAVVKLLVNGRSDLPGPIAHFGLARNGTVYLVAAGRANHAGKAKATGPVPAGDGNELYWGIEAFNDGVGEKWSEAQMNAYALLCAVLEVKINKKNSASYVRGHKESSVTGKVDPRFDMSLFRKAVAVKIKAITAVKPGVPTVKAPVPCPKAWNGVGHLDSSKYMNYYEAILDGAKSLDIDVHLSAQGTPYGLHWPTVGKNHLHDPAGHIKASARIDHLTDAQIDSLLGPAGQHPRKITFLLDAAAKQGTRIELELKVVVPLATIKKLLARKSGAALHAARKLQFKTLATMTGSLARLAPAHHAGGVTILSFTDYNGAGISKMHAYPIVDYTRGVPKWVA